MTKYRKKPVVIDAWQFNPGPNDVRHILPDGTEFKVRRRDNLAEGFGFERVAIIPTLEGQMIASPGDYIVKGVTGEYYPCKPEIFEATYELVED